MSAVWKHHAVILTATLIIFFTNLGGAELFDEDEPKNAVCGVEMFQRGDWVVPTFNQELRTDKPVLIYWFMHLSLWAFGVSEFAVRFHSAVLSVVSVLVTYQIGRRLFDTTAAFWAALALATSLMVITVGRAATPDATLLCCIILVFSAYVWSAPGWAARSLQRDTPVESVDEWLRFVPANFWRAIPVYVAMGLGVLAKGPVGVLLPVVVLMVFVSVARQQSRPTAHEDFRAWYRKFITAIREACRFTSLWQVSKAISLPAGLVITLAVALPWYVMVGLATDGKWLVGFLGGHNFSRFVSPMENHSGPFFYYLPVLCLGFFPWSVFLPMTLEHTRRTVKNLADDRDAKRQRMAATFLLSWAGVWLAFFSLASTKLPGYIVPMYPALALLTGHYLSAWLTKLDADWVRSFQEACRCLAIAGAIFVVALPICSAIFLPGEGMISLVGLVPVFGGIAGFWFARKHQRQSAIAAVASSAVVFAIAMFGYASVKVSRYQESDSFAAAIKRLSIGGEAHLATFDHFSPSLIFYAQKHVGGLATPGDVQRFLKDDQHAFVITRLDRLKDLEPQLPPGVQVLDRQRRFLRHHDLVLLGRPPLVASEERPAIR